MRIGTIYTLYGKRAGAECYTEKIISLLSDKYTNVNIVCYCNKEVMSLNLFNEFKNIQCIYVPLLNNQIGKVIWLEFFSRRIVEKKYKCEVFWVPSGANSFPGIFSIKKVTTILDVGEYVVKNKYDMIRTIYRKYICLPTSLRRSDVITTISKNTMKDIKLYLRYHIKISVIYPGVSPYKINKRCTTQTCANRIIKKELNVQLPKFLFCPGRIDFIGKGLDILLEAYHQLLSEDKNLPLLVFVGPIGVKHNLLIITIKKLNLESKALYFGRVSDECMDALYFLSEAVIFPSRYEGFGFPLLEAMSYKKPIICSSAGSLPEIAGNAALIFENGNASDLISKIEMIYNDKDNVLKKQLIKNGINRVKSFNWENCVKEMYTIFSESC